MYPLPFLARMLVAQLQLYGQLDSQTILTVNRLATFLLLTPLSLPSTPSSFPILRHLSITFISPSTLACHSVTDRSCLATAVYFCRFFTLFCDTHVIRSVSWYVCVSYVFSASCGLEVAIQCMDLTCECHS
ncbi:hypothetical protein PISMIDRAFT_682588 [Pisolithus microcarpus 441]|uniref:Uncharacterized protein n=1 Tax=Pisolithus microcarpus 441 TaxID=765257 RepID=A0A0C9Z1B6_9AGAM|nr:hypothetical protein PISMIDRAFT_682588 [Pisolithus microcarpus 441]